MCDYEIERSLLNENYKYICGIDEVGRGAIFGPVVSGAVILNPKKLNFEIKDSKRLSHKKRLDLADYIYKNALFYSIGWCWNDEIDIYNVLEATKKSIKMAVNGLKILPDYVLIDGMEPDFLNIGGDGIIKGDNKCLSIAAASIIAKVFRDQLLISFAKIFPMYGFERNKGYPTREHIEVILSKGITEFHRRSFRIKKWHQMIN